MFDPFFLNETAKKTPGSDPGHPRVPSRRAVHRRKPAAHTCDRACAEPQMLRSYPHYERTEQRSSAWSRRHHRSVRIAAVIGVVRRAYLRSRVLQRLTPIPKKIMTATVPTETQSVFLLLALFVSSGRSRAVSMLSEEKYFRAASRTFSAVNALARSGNFRIPSKGISFSR